MGLVVGVCYAYNCTACNFIGKEWFNLTFTGHTNKNNVSVDLPIV
jgi:hypothetical protein